MVLIWNATTLSFSDCRTHRTYGQVEEILQEKTGLCRKKVIPGVRFSKYFSAFVVLQAVQNDDDVH